MNSTLTNIKHLSVLLTTASALFTLAQPAKAITNLAPGDFNSILGEVDTAAANNLIDQASFVSDDGFGDVFSTDFLLIGAATSDTTIPTDSLNDNNSLARSINFTLDADDVSGTIDIDFKWAFNGNSAGLAGLDQDNFSISLVKSDLSASALVLSKAATAGYGSGTESITIDSGANSLTAGDYFLQIVLNENSGNSTSSAAGFNQITLTPDPEPDPDPDPTPVPFETSPTLGLLMIGGIYGVNRLRKSKK